MSESKINGTIPSQAPLMFSRLDMAFMSRALYGDGGMWTRPAVMWNETVERDGKVYKRFEKK